MRVRAPETFTLIMVWPIIAQPAIPPKNPATIFATPWPQDSRVFRDAVSVMSSTSFAVSSVPSTHECDASAVRRDDRQRLEVQRHDGMRSARAGRREFTLVAHVRHGSVRDIVTAVSDDDGDQRGRHRRW